MYITLSKKCGFPTTTGLFVGSVLTPQRNLEQVIGFACTKLGKTMDYDGKKSKFVRVLIYSAPYVYSVLAGQLKIVWRFYLPVCCGRISRLK